MFLNCPRCFYLDRKLGVAQPPGFPFSLNSAVDTLLKKEFDTHRVGGTTHPLMKAYGLDAVPYRHPRMDEWRDALRRGITYRIPNENIVVTGAIDDVWIDSNDTLLIVDYKATSKEDEVTLDAEWQIGYKRQMEMYQWLFRMNGFPVSSKGYFVYCNGSTDKKRLTVNWNLTSKLLNMSETIVGSRGQLPPPLRVLRASNCLIMVQIVITAAIEFLRADLNR